MARPELKRTIRCVDGDHKARPGFAEGSERNGSEDEGDGEGDGCVRRGPGERVAAGRGGGDASSPPQSPKSYTADAFLNRHCLQAYPPHAGVCTV